MMLVPPLRTTLRDKTKTKTKIMFKIIFPDGTFRIVKSVAERNAVIAEMKEAYEGYLK